MTYQLTFTKRAEHDLLVWKKSGQKKVCQKIYALFEELTQHPCEGTGHVERLKGYRELPTYSREIDKKSRMVYTVDDGVVTVEALSMLGHYDDK